MSFSRRTVLVVDDDADLRRLIVVALAGAGIEVEQAANGREALELVAHLPPPALILLDLDMPEMTGPEFRRHLLKNPTWASVPVIVMTGGWIPESSLPLGVAGWLSKPIQIQQLVKTVAGYCRS